MTAARIIKDLWQSGHVLMIVGDNLKVVGSKQKLSAAEVELIRSNKAAIIDHLSSAELGAAMSEAIEHLSAMCPDDMLTRLDFNQRRRKRDIDKMPLHTVADVERWYEGWRIIMTELAIDDSRSES